MRRYTRSRDRWIATTLMAALTALVASGGCGAGEVASPASPALAEWRDHSLAGIDRRLGPDYDFYHKGQPAETFPQVYLAPRRQDKVGRPYQIGGPWAKDSGDYSSTQGQILYAPDAGAFGVDRVTIIEWAHGCFTESPMPPWWGGFRPEPLSEVWKKAAGGEPGTPVAMARGMGSWANCGVILFSSGLVGVAGTCTARGDDPTFQFPPHKVPTALAVTNKNEFALVTVCDTKARKAQVAVLALTGSGKRTKFAHEWPDEYPGLPNVAILTRMKLLGYVDLPGMTLATGITAVGDHEGGRVNAPSGHAGVLRVYDLSKQANRDVFGAGSNARYSSDAGLAVAISRSEGKAAFLDLQPLFATMREMYFTGESNFQKTRDLGPGDKQWPYTFDGHPAYKPPVVKVIDVPTPTAVIASMSGGEKARVLIASQDGTVGVYSPGGLATTAPARAEEIQRVGEVKVGRNPTCLAYQKYRRDTFVAVSRGDREIAWIQHTPQEVKIIRRLRDQRLIDPVFVEVSDTHGIQTSLLTVADFKGRKILNYRYSVLVFATQGGAKFGMGADGKDEFECGGILEFPGSPFCISAANVN